MHEDLARQYIGSADAGMTVLISQAQRVSMSHTRNPCADEKLARHGDRDKALAVLLDLEAIDGMTKRDHDRWADCVESIAGLKSISDIASSSSELEKVRSKLRKARKLIVRASRGVG